MNVKSTSYRDRTHEFSSVVDTLRKSLPSVNGTAVANNGGALINGGSRSQVASKTEFNKRASKIGYGIHHTSQKLAKLAKCKLIDSYVI